MNEPDEKTIEAMKLLAILLRCAAVLCVPIITLVTAHQFNRPVRASATPPYLLSMNGIGEKDELLEFRHLVGADILLDKAQIVINGTNKWDVIADDKVNPSKITNGATFRVYVRANSFPYNLGQTNSLLKGVTRSQVRIYGYRLAP